MVFTAKVVIEIPKDMIKCKYCNFQVRRYRRGKGQWSKKIIDGVTIITKHVAKKHKDKYEAELAEKQNATRDKTNE